MLATKIGNARGSVKVKENRVQQLINRWDAIKRKMAKIVTTDGDDDCSINCAYAVLLVMETGIRVGNAASAAGYETKPHAGTKERAKFVRTFGLTTLKVSHASVRNNTLQLDFLGKRGVHNTLRTKNRTLVRYYLPLVRHKRQADLLLDITKYELADFIKAHIGKSFTPKDLRTAKVNLAFVANLEAADHKRDVKKLQRKGQIKKTILKVVEKTAEQIGHTKSVCKSAYISPYLFQFYVGILEGKI